MAGRSITQEFYGQLVAAARQCPGNASGMSRLALCDRRTAARAWFKGWPDKGFAPIVDVIDAEHREARAAVQTADKVKLEAALQQQQQARENAVKARQQEGQVVEYSRAASLVLLNGVVKVGNALDAVTTKLRDQFIADAKDPTKRLDPRETTQVMRSLSSVASNAVRAGYLAMELERLYLGKPASIPAEDGVELTDEQVETELEAVISASRRVRNLRLVKDGVG